MATTIVENIMAGDLPYKLEILRDETTQCENDLRSLIDHAEARKIHLDIQSYYDVVRRIVQNIDGSNRISVLLTDKLSGEVVGLATFLRRLCDDLDRISPVFRPDVKDQLEYSPRKVFYELQYCVRKSTMKSKSVGDVVLACGLEFLGNIQYGRREMTSTVWLVLAGGFTNLAALELYTKYRFAVVGIREGTPLMSLCDIVSFSGKTKEVMKRSLEATFLLPSLKNRFLEQQPENASEESESMAVQERYSDDEMSDTNTSAASSSTIQSRPESCPIASDSQPESSMPMNEDNRKTPLIQQPEMVEKLINLKFRKYVDNLKFSSRVLYSSKVGNAQEMTANICHMVRRSTAVEESYLFFQNLEIVRQIEAYSEKVNKDILDVLDDIYPELSRIDQGRVYKVSYLKKMVRLSWCLYRYSFLEQVCLNWSESLKWIPIFAQLLDEMIENGEAFPENILLAQRDRYNLFVKISLTYPAIEPIDGDGLTGCTLLNVNGLFVNDEQIHDEQLINHSKFKEILNGINSSFRTRLVAFDTQEVPVAVQVSSTVQQNVQIPQDFWQEGRDFLKSQLDELIAEIPREDTILECDCYGVDIYGRLLIDIRSARHEQSISEQQRPSLERFEMALRFLENGVAHPTYESFTSERLLEAFNSARTNRRGGFEDPRYQFIHPSLYRRKRHEILRNRRKRNRKRVDE